MTDAALHAIMPDAPPLPGVGVGIDLVRISGIVESLDTFGEKFLARIFSAHELERIRENPALLAERAAARFAAKEAAIKAFGFADTGIGWKDLEVQRAPNGECRLALHGLALAKAEARRLAPVGLSMSHDGDHAIAIVLAATTASGPPSVQDTTQTSSNRIRQAS